MNYWLLKSEPDTFSIEDLAKSPGKIAPWDGVRNYQARNHLRAMQRGDLAFFYYSSCAVPGMMGVVEIVREAYPDVTAFNSQSPYFDAKSSPDKPRWYCVDVKLKQTFSEIISLAELRLQPKLKNMILLRKGNRLSVMPVSAAEWKIILGLK